MIVECFALAILLAVYTVTIYICLEATGPPVINDVAKEREEDATQYEAFP